LSVCDHIRCRHLLPGPDQNPAINGQNPLSADSCKWQNMGYTRKHLCFSL
jgi:hypothetical protein